MLELVHSTCQQSKLNNIGLEFKPIPQVKTLSILISKGARGSWFYSYFQELLCSIFIFPRVWMVADSFAFFSVGRSVTTTHKRGSDGAFICNLINRHTNT